MQRAFAKLKEALAPLGIEPTLEIREIDKDSFRINPSESNRIWIAGKPMEEWLDANVGSSRCCSVCGESSCRTLQVGAHTWRDEQRENADFTNEIAQSSTTRH